MIPNHSISREIASQRQQDMLAQAQRLRRDRRTQPESVTAEPRPEPRRRFRRVLRVAAILSGR
jgi:hypothetical protein